MKPELIKKLKSPVKVNIEITGPTIGVCDVPIKKNKIFSELLTINHLNKIIEKAFSFEILMFSFILSDLQHLFESAVVDRLNLFCKRINRYGGLTALHAPLNLSTINSGLKDFSSYITQKVIEFQIDMLLFFVPSRVLKIKGNEIGKLMVSLAREGIQIVRIFTNFPSSINEIERVLIPGLKKIAEAASIWKAFNITFIIDKKFLIEPQLIESLENREDIGNFTFSILPNLPPCNPLKFNKISNFDFYTGICPASHVSSTITVYGFPVPCLHLRKYKLPQIDLLWRNWEKVQNSWLLKLEACRQCDYGNICDGLCNLWKKQAI